jgi:menaquinone-dependent protoporphyrinogen oxidase
MTDEADLTGQGRAPRVLVAASSRYGATAGIARAIGEELARRGLTAVVLAPEDVGSLAGYDAVILGSAVYGGHWLEPARELVTRSAAELTARPLWLFSSGPVGDPSRKLSQSMAQDPADLAGILAVTHARGHQMFAGKLDHKNLGFAQRASLLIFRKLEGDFRDWDRIRDWAAAIAAELTGPGTLRAAAG